MDGEWRQIDRCPQQQMTTRVVDVCRCADLIGNGALPASGGYVDQTEIGLSAVEYLRHREAEMRDTDGEA